MDVVRIDFADIKDIPLDTHGITRRPDDAYYGIRIDGRLAAFRSVHVQKNGKVKLCGAYTLPEFRLRGCYSLLVSEIIKANPQAEYLADAFPSSVHALQKNGFTIERTKHFKRYTLHYMRRRPSL
jgi:hypothetical protein